MKRLSTVAYDEKAEARLRREKQDTIKGLMVAKARERTRKREAAECKDGSERFQEQNNDQEERITGEEVPETNELTEMKRPDAEYINAPSQAARAKWTQKTEECFETVQPKSAEKQPSSQLQSDSMLSILAALDMLVPKRETPNSEEDLPKFQPKVLTPYEHTKLSALKRARERRREKEREKRLTEENRRKLVNALYGIKTTILTAEWKRTCHLKERQIKRERNKMRNIARIRWTCKVNGLNISSRNSIFDKILKSEKEKERQALARQQRMKEILRRVSKEMGSKCIRGLMKKRAKFETDNLSKSISRRDVAIASNISARAIRDPDEHIRELLQLLENVSQDSFTDEAEETIEEKLEAVDESITKKSEPIVTTAILEKAGDEAFFSENYDVKKKAVDRPRLKSKKRNGKMLSKVSESQTIVCKEPIMPTGVDTEVDPDNADFVEKANQIELKEEIQKDTNFYTNPSVVSFENFKPHKVYSRKVLIINKHSKWAYLRFHKVDADVWEPIIEIDIDGAAKIQPGLHASIIVTFSPVNSEVINADICFLTLSPEHPECFHELRVPVCCTPEVPAPFVEPRELKFSTAPIWKFNDPKLCEKTLTVSNEGGKPFSLSVSRKDNDRQYFFWTFKDGEVSNTESLDKLDDNDEKSLSDDQSTEASTNRKGETDERGAEAGVARRLKFSNELTKKRIEVPPKVKCRLTITFRPQYVGLHHEVIELSFAVNERIFERQDVPVWAETVGLQLCLNSNFVDLGIVVMDSGVYQRNFDVLNQARASVEISAKTPRVLGDQVSVHPKIVSIQPESFVTLSLRLIPKSDVKKKCKKYYDSTSNQLQFVIQIQAISKELEGAPPLILKVLATLTTCHALVLEPSHVDLGRVHTHEAVLAELSLTNESLVVHDYGFPNLPTFIEIQPNHGFGTILPGETIQLHLVYWPWLTDIPGNNIAANGLSGERRFRIEVVTLIEFAGRRNPVRDKANIPYLRQIKLPNTGVETSQDENNLGETDRVQENDAHYDASSDSSIDNHDERYTLRDSVGISKRSKRKEKSVIDVSAFVVDTFCELSEQVIEFPATPCGCSSMVSVDLRGFNMASYPKCTCGFVKSQTTEFTARYDFRCSSDRVRVHPQNGLLRGNDLVKVTFVFEPKLSKHASLKCAQEPKAERIAEELEKAKVEEQKGGTNSRERKEGKVKKKKDGKKDPLDKTMEHSQIDVLSSEIGWLESFEPRVMTILVTCTINIDLKNGVTRDEILYAKLICPVVKPEIVTLDTARRINFGPTAIGTVSRKMLRVKNISNKNVKIRVTTLNPFGPFFVPPGKTIEPGTILTLPVTYRPTEKNPEHVEEFFEVSAVDTRTVWSVRVSGIGAVPSWSITPEMLVARLEAKPGTAAELKMSIRNTGRCPLTFNLVIIEMLEGDSPLIRPETAESSDKKDKKKKKKDEAAGGEKRPEKSGRPRREKFGANLYEDEVLTIYDGKLQPVEDRDIFEFTKFDENMTLTVEEKEKV